MEFIMEEKINELIESGNIEQALKLQGQLYLIQQSEYISTLIGKRKLSEALKVCNQYEDYEPIQSQKVTILIEQGKLSEALKVCNQYEDYEPMQSQKVTILMKRGKLQEAFDVCSQKKYRSKYLN